MELMVLTEELEQMDLKLMQPAMMQEMEQMEPREQMVRMVHMPLM